MAASIFPPPRERGSRLEAALLALVFTAAILLRAIYAGHFRIDSDEPQHLHVVWAWAGGMLPYRDVFDNHMPLFQALCAPLFKALGVRADIIVPMRLLMAVPFAATIAGVAWIGARLFSWRAGLWSAAVAAFCPPFFLTSLEFRPDNLWTTLWVVALGIFVSGPLTVRRAFCGGLALGFAFAVSMKTTLMLASIALAAIVVWLLRSRQHPSMNARELSRITASALLGVLIPPALVVLYFVARGVGPQFYYCVVQHNVPPPGEAAHHPLTQLRKWLAFLALPASGIVLVRLLPLTAGKRSRALFVFLAATFYWINLVCFWPILTAEDNLPFPPALLAVLGAALFTITSSRLPLARQWLPASLACAIVAGEAAWMVAWNPPFVDQTADKIGIVATALRLTAPEDFVMDAKGETIYRRRPFPYVLEGLTRQRMRAGLITDDIAARLVATRTPLATLQRMPGAARSFIAAEYIPIAFRLSALGKVIHTPNGQPRPAVIGFDVMVPQRYAIVAESGALTGTLNGEPLTGPRELSAGHYEFRPTGGAGRLMLVWASVIEHGLSPFAPVKGDYSTPQD